MDVRTALKDLVGRWQGSNQLWLSPDEPVRQSEGTADVHLGAREAFAVVRYTWADQGQPQDGLLAVRLAPEQSALDGVWIDSWHVGKTFMTLGGEGDRDGGLSLLGSGRGADRPRLGLAHRHQLRRARGAADPDVQHLARRRSLSSC